MMSSDVDLARIALKILTDREERYRIFPSDIFDEYAWNMMLHLFVAHSRSEILTEHALIELTHASTREGQRWLYQLAKDGQIVGRVAGNDVALTAPAVSKLRGYLETAM